MPKLNLVAKVTSEMTTHGKQYEGYIDIGTEEPEYIYKLFFITSIYDMIKIDPKIIGTKDFIRNNIIIELVCGFDCEDNYIYKEVIFDSSQYILFYNLIVELAVFLYHETNKYYRSNTFDPKKRFHTERSITVSTTERTEIKSLTQILK